MEDLLQEFIAETRETLESLAGEIVAWEAAPADRTRLDAIFRFVHTVKGSCGFLDLPLLGRLSHAAEDVLAAVREGKRTPDAALVTAVLAIVDRIGEIVEAIDAGVTLDQTSEELLIAALDCDAVPAVAASQQPAQRAVARSVRLSVDLLDRMMSGMSEMVLARNELARRLRDETVDPLVDAALERLSLTVSEMRDTVTRTRMQRVDALFSALPRLVRDTAGELAKTVSFSIEGADVELDREMIELMRDPLVHIVRNAIDHGIEPPAERIALGKPEVGKLSVSARQSGNHIVLEVVDDGRGINVDRLASKAVRNGLFTQSQIAAMSDREKLNLIFCPGLSSADKVTAISGRGVGMDVVQSNIEQIGGRITLSNTVGKGLAILIHVPLTLSIMSTIVVRSGGQRFAIARQSVDEILTVGGDALRIDRIGEAPVATVRGRRLALVALDDLLGLPSRESETIMIVSARGGEFALGVDSVLDTEEVVVKPSAPAVMTAGVYAGQTLPDSGQPLLLLDGSGIAAVAGLTFRTEGQVGQEAEEQSDDKTAIRALLFDDVDQRRRMLPLAAIDRIESVSSDAIRHTGGKLRLAVEDHVIPLYATAPLAGLPSVTLLRLSDGMSELAYAISESIEIIALPAAIAPATGDDFIAGVVMVEGEQVEVVDVHALFTALATSEEAPARGMTCLLRSDASGWLETFLRPTLEAAGYRCVSSLGNGEQADVTLAMDQVPAEAGTGVPVIRLRRTRERAGRQDDSIYRYDRAALLEALTNTAKKVA